ncbi:MAG: uroporphyrinogen decarboxylase family protein [Ruthenibacterium sp.]
MLARTRVEAALNHRQPDRCPVDFWAVDEVLDRLYQHFGISTEDELLDLLEVDLQFISPAETKTTQRIMPDGTFFDKMGVHRRKVKNEFCTYEEYASSPLGYVEEVADFESYQYWPNPKAFDWEHYSDLIGNRNEKRYIKLYMGGMFEYAWALRGYEQFMMDMACEPEIAHYIMDKICTFWCEYFKYAMEAAGDKIDLIYTYDDIASQTTLLMSPAMLEEFIFPYHRKLNAVIKSYHKPIMYHSCGAVRPVIDRLIALPIDVLNPLQPLARGMDFQELKDEFGDKIAFHGGVCIQKLLPTGTPDEVREAVRRNIRILGKNGGYIMASAHYIQNDTPTENILAMYETALR